MQRLECSIVRHKLPQETLLIVVFVVLSRF